MRERGFTLVELLIVIVVIAILVVISVVAYNGIQDRAHDSTVLSDLSNAQKRLELYRVDLGRYPRTGSEWTSEFQFTKSAYLHSGNNVMFCSNRDTDEYALTARSKSGKTYQLTGAGVQDHGSVAVTAALACTVIGTTWGGSSSYSVHGYASSGSAPSYTDGWNSGWAWTSTTSP